MATVGVKGLKVNVDLAETESKYVHSFAEAFHHDA